jgi:hypothetical protein
MHEIEGFRSACSNTCAPMRPVTPLIRSLKPIEKGRQIVLTEALLTQRAFCRHFVPIGDSESESNLVSAGSAVVPSRAR